MTPRRPSAAAAAHAHADYVAGLLKQPFLKLSEVACIAKVSEGAVRRAVATGGLAALQIGRCYRVTPAAIKVWLAEPSAEAAPLRPRRVAS